MVERPPSDSVIVKGVGKNAPSTVNLVIFVKPGEGKREASVIKQELLAALDPAREGLKIRNLRQAREKRLGSRWETDRRCRNTKVKGFGRQEIGDE